MKSVGKTDNGQHLVEMSPQEYMVILDLEDVMKGQQIDWNPLKERRLLDGMQLAPAFQAIKLFVLARLYANELADLAMDFKACLAGKERAVWEVAGPDPQEEPKDGELVTPGCDCGAAVSLEQ